MKIRVTAGAAQGTHDAEPCGHPNHADRKPHVTVSLSGGPWCVYDGEYEVIDPKVLDGITRPTDLRIAGDLTPALLDAIRAGLGEPGEWDATVVAELVAEIDRQSAELEQRRVRLVAAESDLLNVRGTLSPNGRPRRVPDDVEMVPNVAPAVAWLADETDRLNGVLANYIGWEPTSKEEYEHACGQAEKVVELVREFRSGHPELVQGPDAPDAVVEFVAAVEKSLGVW